ncbi:MAG: peptidylprolyl isomerase, partial [Methylophilaceae bacterium]|nr:peptidylprolyl isomerase [Methylophilaceae bacterium]
VSNLGKGNLTNAPIQTNYGWHVIKVDDVRTFKAPSFDESKGRIQQTLVQNKRLELLAKLRANAKVVQ